MRQFLTGSIKLFFPLFIFLIAIDSSCAVQTIGNVTNNNLQLWLDAGKGVVTEMGRIKVWEDQSPKKRSVTQEEYSLRPLLSPRRLNGKPLLFFKGSELKYDGRSFIENDYTVFIVAQSNKPYTENYILGGSDTSTNGNLSLGYDSSTLRMMHFANDLEFIDSNINYPRAELLVFNFSQKEGRKIYRGQQLEISRNEDRDKNPISTYEGSIIGGVPALKTYYTGEIAEIIIYDKSLSVEDQKKVSSYLIKKYNLKSPDKPPTN